MIIWGYGKVTKSNNGDFMKKECKYCETTSMWRLIKNTTWFTLYFLPIIPYRVMYCVECPKCESCIEISKDQFIDLKYEIKERQRLARISR